MQFAQRQRLFGNRLRPLLAALVVGLLLGFAGPFGSYPAFPTATRYAFWLGLSVAGVATAIAADAALPEARINKRSHRIAAVSLASALPMTFVVAWTMSFIQAGRAYSPQQLLGLYWGVAAVQLVIVFAATSFSALVAQPVSAAEGDTSEARDKGAPAAQFPSALLNRLAPGIGSEIMALETEDHYLRVHTSGGSALILMRMADAVVMLDPRLGAQVHRRWWVAEAAVMGRQSDGQRLSLRLADMTMVPVGRTFTAAVRTRFATTRDIGATIQV